MKLIKKTEFGIIKVQTEDGAPVASFTADTLGGFAYDCFEHGMARTSDHNGEPVALYDMDKEAYVVGDVGQLAGGC